VSCYFLQQGEKFILGNKFIERTWVNSKGNFTTASLLNKLTGKKWLNSCLEKPEFFYEGLTGMLNEGIEAAEIELLDVKVREEEYSLEVSFYLQIPFYGVDLIRHAFVYENAPCIRTFLEVKAHNLPRGDFFGGLRHVVLDSYLLALEPDSLTAYEFFTRTDRTDELVRRSKPDKLTPANLVFSLDREGEGAFFLKESPVFSDQRPEVAGNFQITPDSIHALGWGIRAEEFSAEKHLKTYSSVVGFFQNTFENGLNALKDYQRARNPLVPKRDYMVMANPWGDRRCAERMSEGFVLKELAACRKLGTTHYQLDDGWQKGNGLRQIENNRAITEEYWQIDPERFPNGFTPVKEEAAKLGINLGLWFAPDRNRLYRNYKTQASLLARYCREYGFKQIKLDAVQLRTKEAEDNFEKLMAAVQAQHSDVSFNLDITGGFDARAGYFHFQEYGNIFLENRYTDWANYYPYKTLRNLWNLAAFVPPQKLQIEFLNIDRNHDKYPEDDPLAPANYSYEYVFAITMFANPLCWFEASSLSREALERYSKVIALHKKYRDAIFSGHILPIGKRPDGYSWTGFQSFVPGEKEGFIIVYREYSPEDHYTFKLFGAQGSRITLKSLSDDSPKESRALKEGLITIHLPAQNSFRLYQYRIG